MKVTGMRVHNGVVFSCPCGSGLKKIPEEKRGHPVRRRCQNPKCRKRWKIVLEEDEDAADFHAVE